jgi:hypothetical protein
MMTYAEYLKSQGASEDEIKILDTPVARRAYDRLEAAVVEKDAAAKAAKEREDAYYEQMNTWHDGQEKEFKTVEGQLIAARTREAAAVSALRTAHERGMVDVAKDLGFNLDAPVIPVKKDEPVAIDTSKFVTTENVLALAEREAESIALMSDIAAEHVYLFGAPLRNARELRREALTRKVSLEQVWQEKYGVVAARTAKDAAEKKAAEDLIRKNERELVTAEFASRYGNPETRPLDVSRSPVAPRPTVNREKAPWETGLDGEGGSNDRVRRATQNALKAQTTH